MYEYESLTPEEEESVATWADGTARVRLTRSSSVQITLRAPVSVCLQLYIGFGLLFLQMNPIVLCTIQKKKQRQEEEQQQQQSKEACKAGETKKRAIDRKDKGKGQDAGGRTKRKRRTAEPMRRR